MKVGDQIPKILGRLIVLDPGVEFFKRETCWPYPRVRESNQGAMKLSGSIWDLLHYFSSRETSRRCSQGDVGKHCGVARTKKSS